ncbi:MAG TPA: hypothetical protein ENH91_00945, partial [Leeuwenhoekiella sp.]|nr:hypothetical protein [Leeuwenhoekiella sp.]
MKSKYFKFNIIHLFRFILCAGAFLSLSFNTAPVKKSPKNDNTSAFQLYSALINFQNSAVSPPSGYNKDYGKGFGNATISAIGSTFKYGWKNAATQAPIDISEEASGNGDGSGRNRLGNTYNSATSSEKLAGTFIHLQGNHIAGWQGQPRGNEAYWELEVPNGYLEVTLGLGDMGIYTDSRHTATVEGYSIIAAFQPQPRETKTITMLVKVDDEILTISGLGGYNSKIDYIEVHEIVDDENAVNGVLGFNPQSKNLNLIAGEEQGVLSSTLSGAGATSIGLVIKDDMVTQNEELLNTNDWLTLPENPSTGQLNFTVNALGIQTGGTRNSIVI